MTDWTIRAETAPTDALAALLEEHAGALEAASPRDSQHALDLDGLFAPGVQVWTLWRGDTLAGCGALQRLDAAHAEIKSMRTARAAQRQGVATRMLEFLLDEARRRGYSRVSLETGAAPFFAPAHRLYERAGFVPCAPFAAYRDDPHSVYLTRNLG